MERKKIVAQALPRCACKRRPVRKGLYVRGTRCIRTMFVPFASRVLPPSWAPSICSCSPAAHPAGIIFLTPSLVSFPPGASLFSFSLPFFCPSVSLSRRACPPRLRSLLPRRTSTHLRRVLIRATAHTWNPRCIHHSPRPRELQRTFATLRANQRHVKCPMGTSIYSFLLLAKFIFHPWFCPGPLVSLHAARCCAELIVSLCTFGRRLLCFGGSPACSYSTFLPAGPLLLLAD